MNPIKPERVYMSPSTIEQHMVINDDGLDLIFESLPDKRVAGACMSIFSTADKKLEAVDDMLDDLYRHISALERELAEAARDDEADD